MSNEQKTKIEDYLSGFLGMENGGTLIIGSIVFPKELMVETREIVKKMGFGILSEMNNPDRLLMDLMWNFDKDESVALDATSDVSLKVVNQLLNLRESGKSITSIAGVDGLEPINAPKNAKLLFLADVNTYDGGNISSLAISACRL